MFQVGVPAIVDINTKELDVLDFVYSHDNERNKFAELLNALPESKNDSFFEQVEYCQEDAEVVVLLIAGFNKLLNIGQDVHQVTLFLFLFFSFEGPFCLVNLLLFVLAFLLVFVLVP